MERLARQAEREVDSRCQSFWMWRNGLSGFRRLAPKFHWPLEGKPADALEHESVLARARHGGRFHDGQPHVRIAARTGDIRNDGLGRLCRLLVHDTTPFLRTHVLRTHQFTALRFGSMNELGISCGSYRRRVKALLVYCAGHGCTHYGHIPASLLPPDLCIRSSSMSSGTRGIKAGSCDCPT